MYLEINEALTEADVWLADAQSYILSGFDEGYLCTDHLENILEKLSAMRENIEDIRTQGFFAKNVIEENLLEMEQEFT